MSYLWNKAKTILRRYLRRKHRVNTSVKKNSSLVRVVVQKSNMYVQAQAIASDGSVLASAWDRKASGKTKSEKAFAAGKDLAVSLKKADIDTVVFDRNGHLYHGRVKSFADGLREWWITL